MIELPEGRVKALNKSPNTILFYAKPKQGKTTALSLLDNSILIDTESGSEFVDACKICVDITKPIEEQAAQFKEICNAIYMKGYDKVTKTYTPFYKYTIVDTFSRLDDWSEIVGTINYMDKSQGKKWNIKVDENGREILGADKKPVRYKSTEKGFETVHEIGQGFGYKHSREVMLDWYDKICMLSPKTIFVAHVKDKLVSTNLTDTVTTREINLTGKVKDIVASKVDTIMYGYREGNKFMVSFSGEDGTRCPYLSGKTMMLTESDESGNIITNNWNEIFVEEKILA